MIRIIIIIIIFHLLLPDLKGQDPQYTQFYSAPLYLAPSLAGSTNGSRVSMNFRDQWPLIPGAFVTYSAAFDHYFENYNSGVGAMILRNRAGSGHLGTTQFTGQYSYNVKLRYNLFMRPGLGVSYNIRSIDYNKLVFGDQLVSFDTLKPNSTITFLSTDKAKYLDYALSLMFFSPTTWGGFSVDHILEPNQSFMDEESVVPRKYSLFVGKKHMLSGVLGRYNEESISVSFLYKFQDEFDQFDIGAYWYKYPLVFGLRYRGLPFVKNYQPGYQSNESAILVFGYERAGFSYGISYDITVSRLQTRNTAGALELSFTALFNQGPKVKKRVIPPCPTF